ncbi:hypothetical protein [Variovorax ginsengisoli]|uniref:DUF2388 domain-containing protein n=1 Tax=Variovorax ginsengisoli TaxID=363844 RepID=A0ABT8S1J6_9BURK|nr:hypothetical protein [Variovorax ginsengisoli]MDN8613626.1 hypothetical protein [Variovorax ginsengisoli]MDO1532796.1 hypothetical protein [Variovorax ginsengisoli]
MKALTPPGRAALIASFALAIGMAWSTVRAAEIAVVNGEQWTTSSDAVKKAYLVGVANMVQVERAYSGATPPSDAQSIVPRMARGMQGQTLDSVREGVDRWYAANPTKLKRPVLDIIWFEMAAPGLQKK